MSKHRLTIMSMIALLVTGFFLIVGLPYGDFSWRSILAAYGNPPLSAPDALQADAVSQIQINLSWSDPNPDESNYLVERSPDGVNNWTQIGVVGANTIQYTDSGLTCNTPYYYRVRAFRADDYEYSPFSNKVGTLTQACTPSTGPFMLQTKLQAPTGTTSTHYGWSADISSDGNTAIVSHLQGFDVGDGEAYIYVRSGSTWMQQAKLLPGDVVTGANFGKDVAISGDGNIAVVGAWKQYSDIGAAYVFTRSGSTWTQQQKLVDPAGTYMDIYGIYVDISRDGSTIAIGAARSGGTGAVFIYTYNGGSWVQQARLVGSDSQSDDLFGHGVSISDDGNTLLIGSRYGDGISAETGAAFVFVRSGTSWSQQAKLGPADLFPGDWFSSSNVAISGDGNSILIGANMQSSATQTNAGAAYYFTRSNGIWTQQQKLTPPESGAWVWFGTGPALTTDGSMAMLAGYDQTSSVEAAYLYTLSGGQLILTQKVISTSTGSYDHGSLSVFDQGGNTLLIGASYDDADAGAAYVFVRDTLYLPAPSNLMATAVSLTQINLNWADNSTGETGFQLERSPDGAMSWLRVGTPGANMISYDNTGLTCGTTYYYRVRAVRGTRVSGYSNVSSATTHPCSPVAGPVLLTPADREVTSDNTPEFTWEAVANAHHYQIQIDEVATFASPEQNIDVTGLTYTSPALPDQPLYYWRVRGVTSYGDAGPWSAVRRFTVNTKPPAVPTLTAPVNQTNSPDTTPLFRWSAVAGATQYHLWIDDD
ncbi:MAG TPA: fibronectin type III domain-containing protein, partial [Aggregatilineaceae bacterium]|nr:fibronectin type III domain-containing protein [Aggregatilineaceae bacterium]